MTQKNTDTKGQAQSQNLPQYQGGIWSDKHCNDFGQPQAQHSPQNRAEAEAQGFTVDDTCYPWCAYKGPRFQPTEWHSIATDKEAYAQALAEALQELHDFVVYIIEEEAEPNLEDCVDARETAKAALAAWKEAQ